MYHLTFVQWEQVPPTAQQPLYFPEPDLLDDLVKLFFTYVNVYIPLLHRPTFERSVKEGLHNSDPAFGATVLGVCAVASRYSDDERVIFEGTNSAHSSGYKWFRQLKIFDDSSLRAPSLYDLQALCVSPYTGPPGLQRQSTLNTALLASFPIPGRLIDPRTMLVCDWHRDQSCSRYWPQPQAQPRRRLHCGRRTSQTCVLGSRCGRMRSCRDFGPTCIHLSSRVSTTTPCASIQLTFVAVSMLVFR